MIDIHIENMFLIAIGNLEVKHGSYKLFALYSVLFQQMFYGYLYFLCQGYYIRLHHDVQALFLLQHNMHKFTRTSKTNSFCTNRALRLMSQLDLVYNILCILLYTIQHMYTDNMKCVNPLCILPRN